MQLTEKNENNESADHVDKIREIIFGNQMRAYENRFEELNNRLIVETECLKSDLERRLDDLENILRDEITGAIEKIQKEKQERSEIIYDLTKLVQEAKKNLTQNLADLDAKIVKTATKLQEDLRQQNDTLSKHMKTEAETLSVAIKNGLSQLQHEKVARHDLGELLGEVALRLKQQHEKPPSK